LPAVARALAAIAIAALVAPLAEAGGGPPPGPPEITVEFSDSFLQSLAVFDIDQDGTVELSENVEPDPIQGSPGSFQETSSAVAGGARGTARQAKVSVAGTVLTVTASGDCAAQVTLTGDEHRDRDPAGRRLRAGPRHAARSIEVGRVGHREHPIALCPPESGASSVPAPARSTSPSITRPGRDARWYGPRKSSKWICGVALSAPQEEN
jgi:hypothetical protein